MRGINPFTSRHRAGSKLSENDVNTAEDVEPDHTDDIDLRVFAMLFFQLRRSRDFEVELASRCSNLATKRVVLAVRRLPTFPCCFDHFSRISHAIS